MRRWKSQPVWVRDGLGALVFTAVSLTPALQQYGVELGDLTWRPSNPLHVALILAQTLPLTARRRLPASVLAVIGLAFSFDQSLAFPPSPAGLAMLFALYSAGLYQPRRRSLTVAVGIAVYVVLATILTLLGSPDRVWEFATFALVLAAAWGVGDLVRLRGAAARSQAEEAARAAVIDERARLAGELHDVVSHHVTGMVVQADAAAFLLAPEETVVRGQLTSIAALGRRALADLRELLDVLGSDTSPTRPAIGTLDDLVDQARATGQRIALRVAGEPTGTDEVRLAVYRIAQEGLTNARKHASGASTELDVRWSASEAHVRLVTSPARRGKAGHDMPGSGRGLLGLGERTRRLGGEFRAAPDDAGQFVVEAFIPIDSEETGID